MVMLALQGDVGSGKTVVAFLALMAAAGSGVQGALMAPTEILATQHCERLDVSICWFPVCWVSSLLSQC